MPEVGAAEAVTARAQAHVRPFRVTCANVHLRNRHDELAARVLEFRSPASRSVIHPWGAGERPAWVRGS